MHRAARRAKATILMLSGLRRSLRKKVIAVVLVTTLAALLVSSLVLLAYEANNYREFLIDDAQTQADILARTNAPAIAFNDPETAAINLALLERRRDFQAAALYTPAGEVFASYSRDAVPAEFPKIPAGTRLAARLEISGGSLRLFHPIVEDGNLLGTVYLRASYELAGRVVDYVVILGIVMLLSLLVAALISLTLAGNVTEPILAVARVAREVIERRDFTLRARKTTEDESGVLVDAFNAMLAEVGERAEALQASNRLLQQETEERRTAEAALRRADQCKDEFLATLAHELRNPLAPMVNAMSLLNAREAEPDFKARARKIIQRQLAQLVRLVDDLLDVSRIASGKLVVRKERVELAAIVQNAVDTVRPLLDARDHVLAVTLPDRPVYLDADTVRLAQVFSNLLNNAVKFSDAGGRITLHSMLDGNTVRVEIADEGMGIPAELLPQLFEMFSQGANPVERMHTGLGVGLALAKRLVELHGGTIEAHSAGNARGSLFVVVLPVAALEHDAAVAAPERLPEPAQRHRILLVDDNIDYAESLALLLRGAGHEVRVAQDAGDALELAREFRPDFGLLDLGLPRVSGYALARQLRAQPETARTILIAISGWGQQQHRRLSEAAGFAMHLVKPVELGHIKSALQSLRKEC